ncbi:hypothetical protein LTR70_010288 [Exophiala xenobiotica]|nr:hypothetical protein LTR70_010288 [Exophiala xenobiotica]
MANSHYLMLRDEDLHAHEFLLPVRYGPSYGDMVSYLNRLLDTSSQATGSDGHNSGEQGPSSRKAVLWGLGGIGKTQVALEYAYRLKERRRISVFWVHANALTGFKESYRKIASELEITGHQDPKADEMQLVRDWLESKYETPWLMIIDNVDDKHVLFEKTDTDKSLLEYIPQTRKGSILYTSRNRDVGIDLIQDEPIEVTFMDEAEALLATFVALETW